MSAWVNLFAHGPLNRSGVSQTSGIVGVDCLAILDPPIGRNYFSSVSANVAHVTDATLAPNGTALLWYEIQPGRVIGYERCNSPNGSLRTAGEQSPTLEGKGFLAFGPGWRMSLIERSAS